MIAKNSTVIYYVVEEDNHSNALVFLCKIWILSCTFGKKTLFPFFIDYSAHLHRRGLDYALEFLGRFHPHERIGATWVVELHHRRGGVPTYPTISARNVRLWDECA